MSIDGFRADYLDRYPAPNLLRVARQGVRSIGMIPSFPSKTFPNHLSLVTGVYPSQHGIVGNRFWDPARKALYALDSASKFDGTWYRAEPLWVDAEKHGVRAASLDWPGSDAAIDNVRPSRYTSYKDATTARERADSVLLWLALPAEKRPHLITVYIPDVDHAGHNFPAGDPHILAAIARVDSAIGVMLDGIARLPIAMDTYVILVADHGMTEVSADRYLDVRTMIDTMGVMIADVGPVANFHISGGEARVRTLRDSLNRHLGHGRAYLRGEVPERFHYRSDPRIGDVVVIMDEHWQLGRRPPRNSFGQHGYDNALPSMRALFLAMGPGIKRGRTIAPFENIHVYSLVTELLGIPRASGVTTESGFLRKLIMQ
ncbi:MAG TPA: ectonucleotide pyrophosphatase/phosphodiesterase [Gemmatimonadaceae bacterium]